MPLKALGNPRLVISQGSTRKLRQSSQEKVHSEHRARSLLRPHFKKRTKFVLSSGWASSFSICLSNREPTNSNACFPGEGSIPRLIIRSHKVRPFPVIMRHQLTRLQMHTSEPVIYWGIMVPSLFFQCYYLHAHYIYEGLYWLYFQHLFWHF